MTKYTKDNPDPRTVHSVKRASHAKRLRARCRAGEPCAICGQPIDVTIPYFYWDPNTNKKCVNPDAFTIDERVPVSRWYEGGYRDAVECADDYANLRPAHAHCNTSRGDARGEGERAVRFDAPRVVVTSRDWSEL